MATAATGNPGQVTVTITAAQTAANNVPEQTTSSTLSLIYIYSTSSGSEPTATASSSHSGSHISNGAIAGIVVGCVVFLLLLALALFCYSRHVARRRRAEIASLHPSTHRNAPSRAHSHATTTQQQRRTSQAYDTRSLGARSQGARSQARSSILVKTDALPPLPTEPQELPTPHNRLEMEASGPRYARSHSGSGVRLVHVNTGGSGASGAVRSKDRRQDVSEVYGSHAYPVELQAGSTTDLMEVVRDMKRLRTAGGVGRRSTSGAGGAESVASGQERDADNCSDGYLSPGWPPLAGMHMPSAIEASENGYFPPASVSDMDGTTDAGVTDTGTEYGGGDDEKSIHIYFRPGSGWETLNGQPLSARQSKIAAAMNHASSTTKGSRSTLRSSSSLGPAAPPR